MMPRGKLFVQWGMMGLGRRDLAKEGMNTGGGREVVIKLEGDYLCSCSRANLGTDSA